jgi:hypothetical protein
LRKMEPPVMVQQLIQIAEDGTACHGAAANPDCGRWNRLSWCSS